MAEPNPAAAKMADPVAAAQRVEPILAAAKIEMDSRCGGRTHGVGFLSVMEV